MPRTRSLAALPALLLVAALAPACSSDATDQPTRGESYSDSDLPSLDVETVVDGLDHPWDVQPLGDGRLLLTQRERATVSIVDTDGTTTEVAGFPSDDVWVSSETGLLGLAVDPDFASNGRFYTCQGATTGPDEHDVRVLAWSLDADGAVGAPQVLVSGFPTSTGRHGGCRLLIAGDGSSADGSMYVGTGDAAIGTNPEDLTSLGGKVLRLDRTTGEPWPTNPFITAADPAQRYLQSYGHRNVQGLAERADGTIWDVEHGPDEDDEVNLLTDGGDYGWNPVTTDGSAGYNEAVPMTDQDLPGDQVDAAWSSGDPTVAPSGGTFITGAQWGDLEGDLAVGVLKDQEVLLMSFTADGTLEEVKTPDELRRLGRVRAVVTDTSPGHEGDLLVTTDNGDGKDALYRVTPA